MYVLSRYNFSLMVIKRQRFRVLFMFNLRRQVTLLVKCQQKINKNITRENFDMSKLKMKLYQFLSVDTQF